MAAHGLKRFLKRLWLDVRGESILGGARSAWGAITGTLSDQTDLQAALNSKGSGSVTSIATDGGISGGPITTTGTIIRSEAVNAQTGTTYAILTGDRGKLITTSNGSAIAASIAQAGSAGFAAGWFTDVQNIGAGTLTITPATSTINGAATLVLTTGQSARIVSNGTDYLAMLGGGSAATTPGGSDTEIQFNDAGTFEGDAKLAWDNTDKQLTAGIQQDDAAFDADIRDWWGLNGTANVGSVDHSANFGSVGLVVHHQGDAYTSAIDVMALGTNLDGTGHDVYGLNVDAAVKGSADGGIGGNPLRVVGAFIGTGNLGSGALREATDFKAGGPRSAGGSGPIERGIGFHCDNHGGVGIDAAYGILIADQTGSAQNYAIQTGLGKVEIGDTLQAQGYKSADGSAGVTGTAGGSSFKNGLLTTAGNPAVGDITGLGAGVATLLATPSSANLAAALTDETGSGAAVFATSPTLVTPALGTPSSVTLTNATGLPIGGIAGLGANVGTFLATPSSANLAAALTDETGTGANVFANTPTLVTPVLGAATATSVNKVAITAPATSATLTIADGKTLAASNSLTLTGNDGASVNFGAGGTVSYGSSGVTNVATTSPITGGPITTTGTIALNVGVDHAFTAAQSVSIATAATQATGASLISTTPATSGNQKFSPALLLRGNGWKTTATAASQVTDLALYVKPIEGTTEPSAVAVLATSINGGAYTSNLQFGRFPALATTYSGIWAGAITTPAGNNYALQFSNDGGEANLSGSSSTSLVNGSASVTTTSALVNLIRAVKFTSTVTTYNNIATVSNGIPSELATIDLTAQSAAKGSTTLYTPTATGFFRFSYVAKVTTAASSSSVLGGAAGLVLSYQDGTDSVAVTMTVPEFDQAGANVAIATGNALNTTAAMIHGSCVIYAKTGVAINYTFGYTSVGGTAMQYALRGKLEAM